MSELADKHREALRRAGHMWSVQLRTREGANIIAVQLADGEEVLLPPSTAKSLGCMLIHAATEAQIAADD